MTITGMPTLSSFSRRSRSTPLISGIRTSVMMQPELSARQRRRKAVAEFVGPDLEARRAQQKCQRIAHRLVVIDDMHQATGLHRRDPRSLRPAW